MVAEVKILDRLDAIDRKLDKLLDQESARDIVLQGFEKNNLIVHFAGDIRAFAISPIDIHYLGLRIIAVDWDE